MNKKLVAVAVAGILAAPVAAQAQTANVTLYGRLNMDVEVVNGRQANGTNPNVTRVSTNSSRLGVRGTESLGGGLNAIFQIESNVSADVGGSTLATRETFVGLQGSWGTVKLGNFLAPYDDIHPIFGNVPTLTTSILSTASLWAQGFAAKTAGGFDARLGNSIRYDTPNISGFTASGQVSLGEGTAYPGNVHAYVMSFGGYYTNGPLQAGVAYERNVNVRAQGLDDYALSVAGAWNFGVFRLGGVYERLDYDTPTGSLHRDMFGVSGTIPVGPGTVYAYWGHTMDGKGGAATGTRVSGLARGDNTGADQYEISYTYPLSKRTLTYVGYVGLNNDDNASYTFNINPYTTAIGANLNGIVVGMVHFF